MVDFKSKLITLAGVATLFAGMAHAQVSNCTAASNAVFVAAEGTTEQVSDVTITCPASGNAAATTVNLQVYLSPAVAITSATLGSGSSARSEAMAGVTSSFTAGGVPNASVVAGTVSGSSVIFNNIVIPANAPVTFTITNIKINASQIATSTGAPTAVTETIFIGGTNVTPSVLTAVNVAFSTNALTGVSVLKGDGSTNTPSSIGICTGSTAFAIGSPSAIVTFSEGYATAFKTTGSAATNTALGSEFSNNTYTGYGVLAPVPNTATSGTRVQITFNNIPAGVSVYVPTSITNSGGTMVLTSSATGSFSAVTGSTANGAPGASANNTAGTGVAGLLTVANGSATAVYEEITGSTGSVESYQVPLYLQVSGAVVTAPSSAITATVSFAPIGSTSVPNFVSGSSTVTKNANAFSACTTTLLFPFVTNQLGFDTGIAISNTSTDLLASSGTKSAAAAQSGTCTLTFFGASAPTAATTVTIATGTTYAAAASTLAPGFQGYGIANCNFLYGHGFAYVVYNLTQNNGAAMGYLADVINADRKTSAQAEQTTGATNPEQ